MVNGITNKQIIIFNSFIVMVLNFIKAILNGWHYNKYLIYIMSFFLVFILYSIFRKSFKIDAYILFLGSIMSILFGDHGNLSGANFIIFSLYMIAYKRKIIMKLFIILILTITLRFVFTISENGIIDTIMYLIGFEFFLLLYFNTIHPKIYVYINEDEINKQIIKLLMTGNRTKEIAERLSLTDNAICKRIEKMRNKYECGNTIQLVCKFLKNGQIRQK